MRLSRSIVFCLLSFVLCPLSFAVSKDSLYLGTTVKLDIASPVIVSAANNWQIQNYEMVVNVRLAKKWYPTIELGYAGGRLTRDSISYSGHGGFFRIGCDINPLKKHPESPHALLVGVRLGTAVQESAQGAESSRMANGAISDIPWQSMTQGVYADCWGEIVAGCQVEIAKVNNTAFYMGWMGRFKCLFTRTQAKQAPTNIEEDQTPVYIQTPIYIPGFGKRDNIGWGISYHLGWRF